MEEKQTIHCTVHDCHYCNDACDCCEKKEIKVCNCGTEEKKEATMCDSFQKRKN